MAWPQTVEELEEAQRAIAAKAPPPFVFETAGKLAVAGCFVCFPRGHAGAGSAGDPAWSAAAICRGGRVERVVRVEGRAAAPYRPGYLALREGPILEEAFRALPARPDLLLVNASGRDHPRRCGLALHLGYALDVPSVGVTHRSLYARGAMPSPSPAGGGAPLFLDGEQVARWVRVSERARPLVAHPGWRTNVDTAAAIVHALSAGRRARTPLPIRAARQAARDARAAGQGRSVGPSGPLVYRRLD